MTAITEKIKRLTMEVERVGGHKTIPIDVRIIAATNAPLELLVEQGKFRQDL